METGRDSRGAGCEKGFSHQSRIRAPAVSQDFNSADITLTHDDNGNLTYDGLYVYTYDVLYRIVIVCYGTGGDLVPLVEYEYYGDNRRSQKVVSNRGLDNVVNDRGNTTVVFYDCGTGVSPVKWSLCETRDGLNQTAFQYCWGPGGTGVSPIKEWVLRTSPVHWRIVEVRDGTGRTFTCSTNCWALRGGRGSRRS